MRVGPYTAFTLNFIFPGLGFWAMKMWTKGFINLGVVLLAGLVLSFFLDRQNIMPATFIGIASGAWAFIIAKERQDSQ